jgi:hypothetical protein
MARQLALLAVGLLACASTAPADRQTPARHAPTTPTDPTALTPEIRARLEARDQAARRRPEPVPSPHCPKGSKWTGSECMGELRCPPGTEKYLDQCVAEVRCPAGAIWNGAECAPSTPPLLPKEACTLMANSIPASIVVVDGRVVGPTPQMTIAVAAGQHVVTFVHEEHGKKTVSVRCGAGEKKTVAVKLR